VRALARPAAAILALAGMAALAWVAITVAWGEPVSAIAASGAQRTLRHELAHKMATAPRPVRGSSRATLHRRAAAYRAGLREGDAVGTIVIPRLHLRMAMAEGTSAAQLARGPAHYRSTSVPGLGGTVAVAGHRTTYLHPFRHIDRLRPGDSIRLVMPYGTFRYVVYTHRIVDDHAWWIIRRRSFEKLVLSACHPLYSAAQRYVVFARLRAAHP
jgi:sortase A